MRVPAAGDRVDLAFDVLGWTEDEGRRRGYAARSQLVPARVEEAREDGGRAARVCGLPHPVSDDGVAGIVGYGDLVVARPRAADYAEEVLFGRDARVHPLSHGADGAPLLGSGRSPSVGERESMVRPYRDALWYAGHLSRGGWQTWLLRLAPGHDFVAADGLAAELRAFAGEAAPVPKWREAEGWEALRGDLHPRDLLFAVRRETDRAELTDWLARGLSERGLAGPAEEVLLAVADAEEESRAVEEGW